MSELNPDYYLSNIYIIFCKTKINCIDKLFDKIIKDLSSDIIFLHSMLKHLSTTNQITNTEFIQFIDFCLSCIHIDNNILHSTIYELLIELLQHNSELTLIECALYICSEYGFCIHDIADVIKNNESLKYIAAYYFKDKNMMASSFDTLNKIKELNIDNLSW